MARGRNKTRAEQLKSRLQCVIAKYFEALADKRASAPGYTADYSSGYHKAIVVCCAIINGPLAGEVAPLSKRPEHAYLDALVNAWLGALPADASNVIYSHVSADFMIGYANGLRDCKIIMAEQKSNRVRIRVEKARRSFWLAQGMPARAAYCLASNNIETLEQVRSLSDAALLATPGIGEATLRKIRGVSDQLLPSALARHSSESCEPPARGLANSIARLLSLLSKGRCSGGNRRASFNDGVM